MGPWLLFEKYNPYQYKQFQDIFMIKNTFKTNKQLIIFRSS